MSENLTEQTEQTTVAEVIYPVVKQADEFSDSLSPMLVKELRQGLKGYGFMLIFIGVQTVLAFFIIGSAFASSYDNTGHQISQVVFYLLSMTILIAQPLRGMSAVASEIRENTIELMVMTRLSAWRIVFGKWVSIVSQSALLVAAITPYLILRYFFGGMQLFPEIMLLISMFILSACFTAITVGISAVSSFLIRGIVSAGIAITVFASSNEIFDSRRYFQDLLEICGFASAQDTAAYFIILIGIVYLGWLALDFGASYIAPAAENRATPRRLITLAILTIAAVITMLSPDQISDGLPVILMIFAIPICIISITEFAFIVPSVSAGFLRRGIAGRASRYLLYPGWQSGIWYFLLLYLITISTIYFTQTQDRMEFFITLTIMFSTALFPLTVTKLFFPKKTSLFTYYIAILFATSLLFIMTIFVITITSSETILSLLCWLPPVQILLFLESQGDFFGSYDNRISEESVLFIVAISFSVNWLICYIRSLPTWKLIHRNEQQARAMLASIDENRPTP